MLIKHNTITYEKKLADIHYFLIQQQEEDPSSYEPRMIDHYSQY